MATESANETSYETDTKNELGDEFLNLTSDADCTTETTDTPASDEPTITNVPETPETEKPSTSDTPPPITSEELPAAQDLLFGLDPNMISAIFGGLSGFPSTISGTTPSTGSIPGASSTTPASGTTGSIPGASASATPSGTTGSRPSTAIMDFFCEYEFE